MLPGLGQLAFDVRLTKDAQAARRFHVGRAIGGHALTLLDTSPISAYDRVDGILGKEVQVCQNKAQYQMR